METQTETKSSPKTAKSPRDSAFVTRKIASPDLLNPNGTLFGGVIMSWIDEVAFMSARRYSGRPFVVTANIDNISFIQPIRLGDHVVLTSQVNYVGRSSMEIGVKVEIENAYTGERSPATSAYLTFVALDKKGKPTAVPTLELETPEDHRRHDEAHLRVKVRERMRKHLKRKYERQAAAPAVKPATSKKKSALKWKEISIPLVLPQIELPQLDVRKLQGRIQNEISSQIARGKKRLARSRSEA